METVRHNKYRSPEASAFYAAGLALLGIVVSILAGTPVGSTIVAEARSQAFPQVTSAVIPTRG